MESIMVSLKGGPGSGLAPGVDRVLPADMARQMMRDGLATNPRDIFGKPLDAKVQLPADSSEDATRTERHMRHGKHRRGGYETKGG